MVQHGIIDRYAIGGAVGATFYLEPVATYDVDIFVNFQRQLGSVLITPQPIFDFLLPRGGTLKTRVVQFVEAGVLETVKFLEILTRHGLTEKWRTFQRQVLE